MKLIYKLSFILLILTFSGNLNSFGQVPVKKSQYAAKIDGKYMYVHTVLKGQTLYSIAKAYKVAVHDIVQANNIKEGEVLAIRSKIYIPFKDGFYEKEELLQDKINSNTTVYNPSTIPQSTIAPFLGQVSPASEIKPDTARHKIVVTTNSAEQTEDVENEDGPSFSNHLAPNNASNISSIINVNNSNFKGYFMLDNGSGAKNGQDLMRGAILAAEDLQSKGIDISVVSDAMQGVGGDASFIVAMNSRFNEGLNLSNQMRVPIAAPLVSPNSGNGITLDFVPNNRNKYEKFRPVLNDPNNNVVLLKHDLFCDTVALFELNSVLPLGVSTLNYSRNNPANSISVKLDKVKENIIVVPVNHQGSIEDILSKITSLNGIRKDYRIRVLGTNKWKNLPNINPELLFKANISYPTSHHADRSNSEMSNFYNKYISNYKSMPNAFAMRGYDIVTVIGQALSQYGNNTIQSMTSEVFKPIQTSYRFVNSGDRLLNCEWVIVNMTPEYKIEVE